jgi:outer membrane lipoprotein-sorting protein|tara:strand:+ start:316 stop:864 length:549 start_codon:yes stop_codon:yes gene_type:complete
MLKYLFLLFFFFTTVEASTSIKKEIVQNLINTENITFKFEQNINGKIENGNCIIEYPKKIFCKYNQGNKKILVSNGKSLVIKTVSSYYLYPLNKTPLDLILDKDFLLKKIKNLEERFIDDKFINYSFNENNNKINIFFDKKNYNLIGWQTLDIYQNLSITFLSFIIKNQNLDKNIFKLPKQN